jgi:hypothetical protein
MTTGHRNLRHMRVARRVAKALGEDDCLLAGGLAVSAHGFVRATRDVDLVTRLSLAEAKRKLAAAGLDTTLLRGDALDGGFSCLKGEANGLAFDVLPQLVTIHWELALPVEAGGRSRLRVVAIQDLLALKMKAQGPKDLHDAAMLVLLHPESEARAKELATAYRTLERFESWLDDPRTRAQAEEEARADRIASRRKSASEKPHRKPSRRPR